MTHLKTRRATTDRKKAPVASSGYGHAIVALMRMCAKASYQISGRARNAAQGGTSLREPQGRFFESRSA
jgi:hypothetical protein